MRVHTAVSSDCSDHPLKEHSCTPLLPRTSYSYHNISAGDWYTSPMICWRSPNHLYYFGTHPKSRKSPPRLLKLRYRTHSSVNTTGCTTPHAAAAESKHPALHTASRSASAVSPRLECSHTREGNALQEATNMPCISIANCSTWQIPQVIQIRQLTNQWL